MKKIVLFLLVCLLCGCSKPAEQESQSTAADVTTISIMEETVAPTEETVVLEAVNSYGFHESKENPEVVVMDYRTAAILTPEYAGNDYSKRNTRVQLMDIYTDCFTADILLEGTYSPLLYCAAPEYLALVSQQNREVVVLNSELEQIISFVAADPEGILCEDMERYYYIWGTQLFCQNLVTGDYEPVDAAYDLMFHEVLGYDAGENILLVSAFTGTYSADLCIGALDLDTEEFVLLYQNVTEGSVAEKGVFLEYHDTEGLFSDIYYGDWTDDTLQGIPDFLVNNVDYSTWHITGTDYVCRITYDAAQKVDIVEFELLRFGETVSVCSLQEELGGKKITQMYALPDGNLLAMEVNRRGYRAHLICPDLLEFGESVLEPTSGGMQVDDALIDLICNEVLWEIPQTLEQVREKADALEAEYGVTILLSGQCTEALESSSMTITTTDQAGLWDEAGLIDDALEELDAVLALYPEDFFMQFRNEAGEQGLLVLLVEDFDAELNVIGLSYGMGQWYPIAVDITSGEVRNTYCHEIWHATESRINDVDPMALDPEVWMACNPEDFTYSGNMTESYIEDVRYTYLMGIPWEDVYFVDAYAKVNGMEDRARLMEYVMCFETDAKSMLEYPAMRAKLRILCDAIRQTFDTEQWENVYWERFF